MPRNVDNAFTRSCLVGTEVAGRQTFQPLRAVFAKNHLQRDGMEHAMHWWSLQLSPMRFVDALPGWLGPGAMSGPETILMDAELCGSARTRADSLPSHCATILGEEMARVAVIDQGCVVVRDRHLSQLAVGGGIGSLTMVRVVGPVERGDALAIRNAMHKGDPAWLADFRAVCAMRMSDDRLIELDVIDEEIGLMFIAENLRHYLAALLDRDIDTVGWASPRQIRSLLARSGTLTIRPIETDAYTTFVDVGVCTDPDEMAPSDCSIIYDLPSDSWHVEN